jgi:sugar/nucleoside kinase (ribokinase family)
MSFGVVGLGNALMDAVVLLDDDNLLKQVGLEKGIMHPVSDEKWKQMYSMIDEQKVSLQTGGSCANTIATLGLMGEKVSYCGQVGTDSFGKAYIDQMQEACGHNSIVFGNGATGKCLSLVSPDAERTMLTDLGAAVELQSVDSFADSIRNSKVLYLTGYLLLGDPMMSRMKEAINIAKENGVTIALDVADPFVVAVTKDIMLSILQNDIDMVFLNEEEAKAITGANASDAIDMLKSYCSTVVVKLGSKGSIVYHNGKLATADIFKVNAVDTTGAGDSYAAGFLYGWVNKWSLEKSAALGSRIAAETVAQLGAVVRERTILNQAIAEVG